MYYFIGSKDKVYNDVKSQTLDGAKKALQYQAESQVGEELYIYAAIYSGVLPATPIQIIKLVNEEIK